MNTEEKKEIKDMLSDAFKVFSSDVNAKQAITNNHLSRIDKHLSTLNGKVLQHEKLLSSISSDNKIHYASHDNFYTNRIHTCPHINEITKLKNDKKIKIGVKQTLIGAITLISLMLGIAFTTIQMNQYFQQKQTKEIIDEIGNNNNNNDKSKNSTYTTDNYK